MDAMTIQRQQTIADIEKMAGSVKKLSTKQIGEMDEELVQQQLDLETTQERRENFLEGRGMALRNDFVDRRAHVLGHEPVLRRGDTKSERRRDKKVTKLFEGSYKNIDREQQQERRTYARNEETAFIRTRSFATPGHYRKMVDAKKLMTQNPENYAANRQAADAVYRDLYAACEVHGTYVMKMRSYDSLQQELEAQVRSGEISGEDYESMSQEAHRRAEIEGQRQELVERRIQTLTKCLEMFVGGADVEDSVKEAAQAYMPVALTQGQREEMRRHLDYEETKKDACRNVIQPLLRENYVANYVRLGLEQAVAEKFVDERIRRWDNLSDKLMYSYREGDEEWNRSLARAIFERDDNRTSEYWSLTKEREVIQPFVDYMFDTIAESNIDVEHYFTMSDEELKKSMTEFEDYGILSDAALETSEINVTSDNPKYKFIEPRDFYIQERGLQDGGLLLCKMRLLSHYTRKARLLWQIGEYRMRVQEGGGYEQNDPEEPERLERSLAFLNAYIESDQKKYKLEKSRTAS